MYTTGRGAASGGARDIAEIAFDDDEESGAAPMASGAGMTTATAATTATYARCASLITAAAVTAKVAPTSTAFAILATGGRSPAPARFAASVFIVASKLERMRPTM